MPLLITALISWATRSLLVAIGLKLAFASFMIFIFPLILKKFLFEFAIEKINVALAAMGDTDLGPVVIDMTGVAGYLTTQTRLDDCFAVLLSAVITSFFLKLAIGK